VFDFVTAYSEVLSLVVKNIPLGLSLEEDPSYNLEIRDGLFECTLLLFKKVTDYFGCTLPQQESGWEVIKDTNTQIEMLLAETHSDKDQKIFTPDVYNKIKSEKTFKAFIFGQSDQAFIDDAQRA
jgi:hypothetical protein